MRVATSLGRDREETGFRPSKDYASHMKRKRNALPTIMSGVVTRAAIGAVALSVGLGCTALAAGAVVDRARVVGEATVGSWYVGDVSEGAGQQTLVAWAEGPPGRSRPTSGQGSPAVYGPIYGGYLFSDAPDWERVAPDQWVNDVDITEEGGRPVVAWANSAGLFLSEMVNGAWLPPVTLWRGPAMAVAAAQPADQGAAFVAAVRSGKRARLVVVQRGPSGWAAREAGTTSPQVTPLAVDAAWLSPGTGGAPGWWGAGSLVILAPNARNEVRSAVWVSGALVPIKNYGVRRGQGGLASRNGSVLAHVGGDVRRGRKEGVFESYPAGPSTVRTRTLSTYRPDCDVSAFGAGFADGSRVLLSSGGCGIGIGALVGNRNINLMPSSGVYPLMVGSGAGTDYTSVLTWLDTDRSLWVLWIK